jgi:hypothetical protein
MNSKLKNIFLFIFLTIFFSCENDHTGLKKVERKLQKTFPVEVNNFKIVRDVSNPDLFFLEFSGTFKNGSDHYLNKVWLFPRIEFTKITGASGDIKIDYVNLLNPENPLFDKQDQDFRSGEIRTFNQRMELTNLNINDLKYKYKSAYFTMRVKGSNKSGYLLGSESTYDGASMVNVFKMDILKEWSKILR